jgi:hypothetical protein
MDAGRGAGKKHTFAGEGSSKGVSQDDKVLHTTIFFSKYVSTTYKRIKGTFLDFKRMLYHMSEAEGCRGGGCARRL